MDRYAPLAVGSLIIKLLLQGECIFMSEIKDVTRRQTKGHYIKIFPITKSDWDIKVFIISTVYLTKMTSG